MAVLAAAAAVALGAVFAAPALGFRLPPDPPRGRRHYRTAEQLLAVRAGLAARAKSTALHLALRDIERVRCRSESPRTYPVPSARAATSGPPQWAHVRIG